jgi:hypothetical protein
MNKSNYILHQSLEMGLDRLGSAILFGVILKEYKNNNKTIESLVDTLLTITSLDKLKQMIEDYDRVGDN